MDRHGRGAVSRMVAKRHELHEFASFYFSARAQHGPKDSSPSPCPLYYAVLHPSPSLSLARTFSFFSLLIFCFHHRRSLVVAVDNVQCIESPSVGVGRIIELLPACSRVCLPRCKPCLVLFFFKKSAALLARAALHAPSMRHSARQIKNSTRPKASTHLALHLVARLVELCNTRPKCLHKILSASR